jgi:enoyl-CoA hydratase/carnithine racemase
MRMANVALEDHGKVALLRMTNGTTNAIGAALADEMAAALREVTPRFKGLVLAGNRKFFSIGLNLPELLALDRSAMADFWRRFEDLVLSLYTLPIPTAAAVCGHATAGGAILALTGDFRFIAAGRKLIGVNEVKIGLPLPYLPDRILRQVVGDRAATAMAFAGEFLDPAGASAVGLVDGVFPEEEVEGRALEKIDALAALPSTGIALIKENRVGAIRSDFEARRESLMETFMRCWFSPTVSDYLREASQKF